MSIFSSILSKLGFGGSKEPPKAEPPKTTSPVSPGGAVESRGPSQGPPVAPPRAISPVDVVSQLDAKAAANSEKLNWKTSIVDLLKLLDLDSSMAARKTLGEELGCPSTLADGSAEKNNWLHQAVLKKLAENGGNIPADLLDGPKAEPSRMPSQGKAN